MRVHHLNCGTMRPFGGRLVDGSPGLLRRAEMVCHCLLVETPQGLVLVDTGLGTSDVDDPRSSLPGAFRVITGPVLDRAETAVAQVALLGFDPADVRHVVLTHLDLDHAGGLRDFPRARVHVHGPELRAATGRRAPVRYRPVQWAHGPDWVGYDQPAGERWFGFDAVRSLQGLPEEILLLPLPGHSVGHAGVAVHAGDRWLLHAGDAYFSHRQLAPTPSGPPGLRAFQSSLDSHRATRVRNQQRLQQLAVERSGELDIVCAHDPVELHRHLPGTAHRDG